MESTRHRRPLELIYYEAYRSLEDAKVREKRLKRFKNGFMELKKRINHSVKSLSESGGG